MKGRGTYRDVLQDLVDEDNGHAEIQHRAPLCPVERRDREQGLSFCLVSHRTHPPLSKGGENEEKERTVKNGIYNIAKCSAMLSAIAATRNGFRHSGSLSRLSFSESEFIALNISTVTRIESDIVVARCAIAFVNMSQPIVGKRAEQEWKCVYEGDLESVMY